MPVKTAPGLIDTEEIARKVAFGASELDQVFPEWFERINLRTLDLKDGIKCVLGQLYGAFVTGREALGWEYEECDERGFYFLKPDSMSEDDFSAAYKPYYVEAQKVWIGIIADKLRGED